MPRKIYSKPREKRKESIIRVREETRSLEEVAIDNGWSKEEFAQMKQAFQPHELEMMVRKKPVNPESKVIHVDIERAKQKTLRQAPRRRRWWHLW